LNAPLIRITVPASGATVSGTIPITAELAAGSGIVVESVGFWVDDKYIGAASSAPYSLSWDSATVLNGTHVLAVRLGDNRGQSVSTSIQIVTSNTYPPFDPGLEVPLCGTNTGVCDSGPQLYGRAALGPEPNRPNTINGTCSDGGYGYYHYDESNDRIRVRTLNGQPFVNGAAVRIEATVWNYGDDSLDLFYAADATNPVWTFIGTLTPAPTGNGPQVLSATYVLPVGTLQAVRAQFRYFGSAATSCDGGGYTDHDDLAFVVANDPEAAPQSFYTLPPCRLLDTRLPAGTYGGPALIANTDRTYPVAGVCGIPATAKAVSANVTVASPTSAGDLRLFPAGQPAPLTSVINFAKGQIRANNAIVKLNASRMFAVRDDQPAGARVDLILDVNGYFE
jgi:hypothetical protein